MANKFKYSGSNTEKSGRMWTEVNHRIQWIVKLDRNELFDKKVSCKVTGKFYRLVKRPGMLHGSET